MKPIPMFRLTPDEVKAIELAEALPTDALRQGALSLVDAQIRERLQLPEKRFYHRDGDTVTLDLTRNRVPPVRKISKSDQRLTPEIAAAVSKTVEHLKDL